MEQRKNELEANLDRLQTEAGVEEELRNKFQVKREGEDYIVIIDNGASEKKPAPESPKEKTAFEKIEDFVKNIF